ncbi:MAG: glycerate kinase [Actinomycetaceae bacterium]|nr:glycerate kinase [Actinomycetaceae bacterium]
MKVILAPDSFKESMSSVEAATAMERGIRHAHPTAECVAIPLSDGGEGFAQTLGSVWGAEWVTVDAVDVRGLPATYGYAWDASQRRAALDVASCGGLEMIPAEARDVWSSSTKGLGLLIHDALGRGAQSLTIGLGGSATNDGGAGMLSALGVRFEAEGGGVCTPTPDGLQRLSAVDASDLDARLADSEITVACDVDNPLLGPRGATAVFGPQKGVGPDDVEPIDAILGRLARLSNKEEEAASPGAGAAGGLGWAMRAFLGATLVPGFDVIARATGLAEAMQGADVALTGEGAVDDQTLSGKAPAGVARLAREAGVPVVIFGGVVRDSAQSLREGGAIDLIAISNPAVPLEQSLAEGPQRLEEAVAQWAATLQS